MSDHADDQNQTSKSDNGHHAQDDHGHGGHDDHDDHGEAAGDIIPEKSWQDALLSLFAVVAMAGLCFMMIAWNNQQLAPVLHEVEQHSPEH